MKQANHKEWFSVDVERRAAKVRSWPLSRILRELVANSLDAEATSIRLSIERWGKKVSVICEDNGVGCKDPEILRRVGSSTSDIDPGKRGRFGHGLIDFLCACEEATIRIHRFELSFHQWGYKCRPSDGDFKGMRINASLIHDGRIDEVVTYMASLLIPDGVRLSVNSKSVPIRHPIRTIEARLKTVIFDPETMVESRPTRPTKVEILKSDGPTSQIYELGIPVDTMPWSLPFDVNVVQKTPLDVARDTLPTAYKEVLLRQLVGELSGEYEEWMAEANEAPQELANDSIAVECLTAHAREVLVQTVIGCESSKVVRRNPFDADDRSESQELETKGYVPLHLKHLPAGVRAALHEAPSVSVTHDSVCKVSIGSGLLPPETDEQQFFLDTFARLASAVLDKPVRCERIAGGSAAACCHRGSSGEQIVIRLNIDFGPLWQLPITDRAIGIILHECAHVKVSGHTMEFCEEVERLAGRLVNTVINQPSLLVQ